MVLEEQKGLLVEASSEVLGRFEAATRARGISHAALIELSLDAFVGVNIVPKEVEPLSPSDRGSLKAIVGSHLEHRVRFMAREAGWSSSVMVATAFEALEATETRSRTRLSAGTHRIVRLQGNLSVLEHLERVPNWIPRTVSDLLGLAMRNFGDMAESCQPSIKPHDSGYLDVEVPIGHITWLDSQARARGCSGLVVLNTALQILYDELDGMEAHDFGADDRLPLVVPSCLDSFTPTCAPARWNWVKRRAAACEVPLTLR